MDGGGLQSGARGREDGGVVGASDGGGAAGVPVAVGEAGGGLASVAERAPPPRERAETGRAGGIHARPRRDPGERTCIVGEIRGWVPCADTARWSIGGGRGGVGRRAGIRGTFHRRQDLPSARHRQNNAALKCVDTYTPLLRSSRDLGTTAPRAWTFD
jgi:hypothetical protein